LPRRAVAFEPPLACGLDAQGPIAQKVWLDPVGLQKAVDLKPHEIREILRWHDHFRP
jgi:hypothetical protein